MLSRRQPCSSPKDQQIRKRVPPQPIRAVQSRCCLARSEQSRQRTLCRLRLHANPAHHVVQRRSNFHRPCSDVHVRQLFELVVHARQFFLHVLRGLVRNVQIRAAMLCPPPLFHLRIDRPRHHVPRR